MAGTKKASFRGGGGFLNDVDGKIVRVQVGTDTPFANAGGFLYLTLTVKVDGQEDAVNTSLFLGGTMDEYSAVEGRESAVSTPGGRGFSRGLAGSDFIASVEEIADPPSWGAQANDEDSDVIDYAPLVNLRLRFKQQPLDATELAALKRKGKATTRKDANGKEWPLTKLVATQFYGYEVSRAAGKAVATSKGKPASDVAGLASEVLKGILTRAPGKTLTLAKLSTPILQAMLKHEQKGRKEEVRSFLMNEKNLAAMDDFAYDTDAQTISM